MNNKTVHALIRTAEGGQTVRAGGFGRNGRVFITVLFATIALFLLAALLVGTNSYRAANDARTDADTMRLGLSLIANSIRMNDATDAVGVADGPEGLALVLTEHADSGDFETRLYAYRGSIVEEYARSDAAFAPERAREIVASNRFEFTYAGGLLTVYTDQGSTCIALRSVRGGA